MCGEIKGAMSFEELSVLQIFTIEKVGKGEQISKKENTYQILGSKLQSSQALSRTLFPFTGGKGPGVSLSSIQDVPVGSLSHYFLSPFSLHSSHTSCINSPRTPS